MRKNSIQLSSGGDADTYWFGFPRNPREPIRWAENTSQPNCPCAILTRHVTIRSQTPRATVLADTREQYPFNFSLFRGWIVRIGKKALMQNVGRRG